MVGGRLTWQSDPSSAVVRINDVADRPVLSSDLDDYIDDLGFHIDTRQFEPINVTPPPIIPPSPVIHSRIKSMPDDSLPALESGSGDVGRSGMQPEQFAINDILPGADTLSVTTALSRSPSRTAVDALGWRPPGNDKPHRFRPSVKR